MGIVELVVQKEPRASVCKDALLLGLRKLRNCCESIARKWDRECMRAAEIERLRDLERARIFERSPWIGWL